MPEDYGDPGGQLPYNVYVDAARGGAQQFAQGLRPLSKQEKLDATLGGLQTFFARIGSIGTPPQQQDELLDLAHEGLARQNKALQAPAREQQQNMIQQAAHARAQMEAQQLAAKEEDDKQRHADRLEEFIGKISPDLGPAEVPGGGPPGPDEAVPSDLLSQIRATGNLGLADKYRHPGLGDARHQGELEQRQSFIRAQEAKATATEKEAEWTRNADERNARIDLMKAQADRARKGPQGKIATDSEVRGDITAMLRDEPNPSAVLDEYYRNHLDESGNLMMGDKSKQYLKTMIDKYKRMAKPKTGSFFKPMSPGAPLAQ